MKRQIIRFGLTVLFGLVIMFTFCGCSGGGKLNGVYASNNANAGSFEFKSGSKAIWITSGFGQQECEYKTENDKLTITNSLGFTVSFTIKDKNTIVRQDGVIFTKK